jgi:hypothetical protein
MTTKVVGVVGSLRSYAAHRKECGFVGGSLSAVQKAIKTGRIKTTDGKIYFESADKSWEENSDHRQQRQNRGANKATPEEIPSAEMDTTQTFLEAQRQHEWLKVQKEEMELRKRRGELFEKHEAEEKWGKLLTAFRNRMGIVPDNLAPRVAVLGDVLECRALIEREMRQVLTALSEYQPDAV